MVRVLKPIVAASLLCAGNAPADEPGRHDLAMGLDAGYVDVNAYESWTDGSVGKLRFSDSGSKLGRSFLDYRGRLTDTLHATVVLEAYDDDIGEAIDFTEAFVEWRPVPSSATRYRLKLGAFYPRISLENVDRGWSSPYSLNFSTINTWVAEELRSFGAELTVSHRLSALGGAHEFSASGSLFQGNDPAGSLLAWKGWSVHDRQSRFGDRLPLPPLPQIQPGGMFERQDPYVAPFREFDGRTSYYLNLEWRVGSTFLVRAMHYDNRADPKALHSGQYGWRTRFEHAGLQATLPGEVGLLAQWMSGLTLMGPVMPDGAHPVDVEYESYYLMLTRSFGRHRISARYDNFDMSDNDSAPQDSNAEHGLAWTIGYRFDLSDTVNIAAEWLDIETRRSAFAYFGLSQDVAEQQAQLLLQLRF